MKKLFTLIFTLITFVSFGQNIINGDFEFNDGDTLVGDYVNLDSEDFNDLMFDCHSYGSFPNIDILSATTFGFPQSGNWFVAITGGQTDRLNMKLSDPLVAGETYTLTFYDRKAPSFETNLVSIGVSTVDNDIGDWIYTAPALPEIEWTERSVTFEAPNAGQFISVYTVEGDSYTTWTILDNFSMSGMTNTNAIVEEEYISLVQNPVSDILRLKTEKLITQATISIVSTSGKIEQVAHVDGIDNLEMDVSNLAAGFYILNVLAEGFPSYSIKFVKM